MTAPAVSPWLVAVEGVTRTRPAIRQTTSKRGDWHGRHRHEAVEWQTGLTLGVYLATLAVTSSLSPVVLHPFGADELHRPDHGGTGALADHYPEILCGTSPRPEGWRSNDTRAAGKVRGQHERAAWAIAMRAACAAAGRPWNPRTLLAQRDLPPVIGIDPGAEWTGIVACVGSHVLDAATVGRPAAPDSVTGYEIDRWVVDRIVQTLAHLLTVHRGAAETARSKADVADRQVPDLHNSAVGDRGLPQRGSLAAGRPAYHPPSTARISGEHADARRSA